MSTVTLTVVVSGCVEEAGDRLDDRLGTSTFVHDHGGDASSAVAAGLGFAAIRIVDA